MQVTVLRHGRSREIDVRDLLVGDVLCFGAGDILPADGLIFNCSDVRWVPALLTHGKCGAVTTCCCTSAQSICCMLLRRVSRVGAVLRFGLCTLVLSVHASQLLQAQHLKISGRQTSISVHGAADRAPVHMRFCSHSF